MVPKVPQLDLDAPECKNLNDDAVKDMGIGEEEILIPKVPQLDLAPELEQNGFPNWILEMDLGDDAIPE